MDDWDYLIHREFPRKMKTPEIFMIDIIILENKFNNILIINQLLNK